jgi:hypothetical protein
MGWKPGVRGRAAARWLGDHILGAVVGIVVAIAAGAIYASLSGGSAAAPPPLAAQWEQERAALAREGWEVTADREVEMRGNTQPVTVLGLHFEGECKGTTAQPSDQVRIYEVDRGELRRAFLFQPSGIGCHAWTFHLDATADLTGSGRTAVFGEFVGSPLGEPGEKVPVVIAWHEQPRHYIAYPLITEAPTSLLRAIHAEDQPEWFQRHALQMFRQPLHLAADARQVAYGASELHFALHGAEDSYIYGIYRLTSGVPRKAARPGPATPVAPIVYQRAVWHLEALGESVAAGWCRLRAGKMAAIVPGETEPSGVWFNACDAPLTSQWWEFHHPNS